MRNIIIEDSDHEFFNSRIPLIPEEENLKIYEKINFIEEKNNKKLNLPFNLVYNEFIKYCDKLVLDDYIFSNYFMILNNSPNLFITQGEGVIIYYDENFKNFVEIKILEFFAFFIQYNKSKIREKEDEEEKRLEKLLRVDDSDSPNNNFCFNAFQQNLQLNTVPSNINNISFQENNLNNVSFTSTSSFKKSLLKPFNKEEILLQEECDVDYGRKKITRRDMKIREEYVKNVISNANRELIQKVEDDIIQGKFEDKKNTVVFCMPTDRKAFINKLN
jgi:hypothetical protein